MVLETFVLALWGFFVSAVEERLGKFDDLSPNMKQLVNALLAFAIPVVAQYFAPIWQPEFGDINEVVKAGLFFVVPAIVAWVSSQGWHLVERNVKLIGNSFK